MFYVYRAEYWLQYGNDGINVGKSQSLHQEGPRNAHTKTEITPNANLNQCKVGGDSFQDSIIIGDEVSQLSWSQKRSPWSGDIQIKEVQVTVVSR